MHSLMTNDRLESTWNAPWTWHVNTTVGHSYILFQSFPLPVWIHRMLVLTSPGIDKASLSIRLLYIPNDLWHYHHFPSPTGSPFESPSPAGSINWEVGCSCRKSLGISSWACAYFLSHCFRSCLDVNSLCHTWWLSHLPCHGGLKLYETMSPNKSFLPHIAFLRDCDHSKPKITNTGCDLNCPVTIVHFPSYSDGFRDSVMIQTARAFPETWYVNAKEE